MEIYERIIEELEGRNYKIHHQDELSYDYLGQDGYSIEVLNESGLEEDSLFIEYDGVKYAILFNNCFEEFYPEYEEDIYFMLREVRDIFDGKKCAALLYYNADGFLKLLASGFMKEKEVKGKKAEEVFRYIYMANTLAERIKVNGGKAVFRFWKEDQNIEIEIPKEEKKNFS